MLAQVAHFVLNPSRTGATCAPMKTLAIFSLFLLAGCVTTEPVVPPATAVTPTPEPVPKPAPLPPPPQAEPLTPPPSLGGSPTARPPIPEPPSPLAVAKERLSSLADQAAEQERLVDELSARNNNDLEPRIRLRLETELLAELRRLDELRTALRSHQRLVERLEDASQ
jgi:hypothetical protein